MSKKYLQEATLTSQSIILKKPFLYSINQRNIKKNPHKKSSKCIKNVRKINLMIA